MRRKIIGAAIVTVAAALTVAHASAGTRSAVDEPTAVGAPRSATIAATQAPARPVQSVPAQREIEGVDGTPYDATGTIANTGWQVALGAYYLGGELIESGGIVGTQIGSMLGLWSIRTEPATEEARLRAWSDTGEENLTPVLPTSAARPVERVPRPARTPSSAVAPTPAAPVLQAASLRNTPAIDSPKDCAWPEIAIPHSSEAEAAVMANLTDLGLLDEPAIRLPDGAVFLPKVTQRLLQIRTGYPCEGAVSSSRTLVGHVIADPTASGLVQASQDGRIEAESWGLPRLGQRVTEGEVLGYLRPIWSNRDQAETEARIATLRGEIAEKELELARSRELPLLPFRQGRILSIRIELDKLRRNRDALVEGLEGAKPILATASGVIARADARIGQVVSLQHLLWEIVDERRLWVEAEWFGGEPPASIRGASATRADGTLLSLAYEGGGWAMTAQSTPLQFRVTNPVSGLRVGERVSVLVREPVAAEAVLVPRSALIRRGNGETGLWAATSAERFEPYLVRWKPVDGSTVMIEAGLPEGARVVISGATLLSEVR